MECVEIAPPEYNVIPDEYCYILDENEEPVAVKNRIEYIGHGTDILGDEFEKAIRHEMIVTANFEHEVYSGAVPDIPVTYGDISEDEDINIADVIGINRNIFGKLSLNDYAKLAADVNHDGIVDATDSLEVMKYIVGLNETLG